MAPSNSSPFRRLFLLLTATFLVSEFSFHALGYERSGERGRAYGVFGRRALLSFKETPRGSNVTFECSPSGPCVSCLYSEKNDEKFRCSETGYRIPLKCMEIKDGSQQTNSKKSQNGRSVLENPYDKEKPIVILHDAEEHATSRYRNLQDESSALEGGSQAYITYRSCIPTENEERLSVLGFEGIVLFLLLISGSVVYLRGKRATVMPGVGAGRVQMTSRF
ncbi:uncharacterized protein LOC131144119 isoform X2 [Malania oleifera]|uniref:uncharacterized protein LOC131144119 isoform X2 n=1 Tax=Malania oleifera TaxID=397392 RepID=UPI0025AE5105|nr:uncharacterized protein LOC131144119 isoform X2 [Malania oleifera]